MRFKISSLAAVLLMASLADAVPVVICDNDGDIDAYLSELCLAYHSRGEIELLALVTTFVEADSDNYGHAVALKNMALRSGMNVSDVAIIDGQQEPDCLVRPTSGVDTDTAAIPDDGVSALVTLINDHWKVGDPKIQYWLGGPRSSLANAWALDHSIAGKVVAYGGDNDTGSNGISTDLCNYNGAVDNWASEIVFARFEWKMTSALATGVSPDVPKAQLDDGDIPDVELRGFLSDKVFDALPHALPNQYDSDSPGALRAMLGSSYVTASHSVVFSSYIYQPEHVLGWSGCDPSCIRFVSGPSNVSHATGYNQSAGTTEWWRAMSGTQSPAGGAYPDPAVTPRSQPFDWPAPAPTVIAGDRVQIEQFNWGGNGYGYSDNDFGGWRRYRTVDRVDILDGSATTPAGIDSGGAFVTYEANEWTEYSVSVPLADEYVFRLAYQTPGAGRRVILYVDGVVIDTVTLPNTAGSWRSTDSRAVELPAGPQTWRVEVTGGEATLDYLELAVSALDHTCVPIADQVVSGWSSQETHRENGRATNAQDDSTSTLWVSRYSPHTAPPPHRIDFTLGGTRALCKFVYTPRQDTVQGRIKDYELYTCLSQCGPSGTGWTLQASGSFASSAAPTEIEVSPTVFAAAVRLRATTSWPNPGTTPWATAAEIDFYHDEQAEEQAPIETDDACALVAGPVVTHTDSQETIREDGRAVNIGDGSTSTLWVTRYSGSATAHPHFVDLSLDGERELCRVIYTPRQTSSTGRIGDYELHTCLTNCEPQGSGWSLHSSGTFPDSPTPTEIEISPTRLAAFVRLRSTTSWPTPGTSPWASAAEIAIYHTDDENSAASPHVAIAPANTP